MQLHFCILITVWKVHLKNEQNTIDTDSRQMFILPDNFAYVNGIKSIIIFSGEGKLSASSKVMQKAREM